MKEFNLTQEENKWVARRIPTGTVIQSRKSKKTLVNYLSKNGYKVNDNFSGVAVNTEIKTSKINFSVTKRFDMLEKTIQMTGLGITPSTIIAGDPGVGKTHSVMNVLHNRCFKDENEYAVIKGYVTPKGLYRQLFENRNKLVIFDDTDSILKDTVALNLLKAALDSYSKRVISWRTESFIPTDLPDSFEFKGQVIFISNLSAEKIDDALKTRSLVVDVSMTKPEKIERMTDIIHDIMPDVETSMKIEVLDYINEKIDYSDSLSIRTLMKLVNVRKTFSDDWKDMALYLMVNE